MNLGIVASGVVPAPLGTTFNPLDKSAAFSLDAELRNAIYNVVPWWWR